MYNPFIDVQASRPMGANKENIDPSAPWYKPNADYGYVNPPAIITAAPLDLEELKKLFTLFK
jgi:hypothetical protein